MDPLKPQYAERPDFRRPTPVSAIFGLVIFLFTLWHELSSRPIQPIFDVPAMALLPFGSGLVFGVFENRRPVPFMLGYYAVLMFWAFQMIRTETSLLPLGLYVLAYGSSRYLVTLKFEE